MVDVQLGTVHDYTRGKLCICSFTSLLSTQNTLILTQRVLRLCSCGHVVNAAELGARLLEAVLAYEPPPSFLCKHSRHSIAP
jgi:hypothetical protein